MVRIEAEVPRNRMLLSDYDAWHFVLNGWCIPLTPEENDHWNDLWDQWNASPWAGDGLKPNFWKVPENKAAAVVSWPLIFDLERIHKLLTEDMEFFSSKQQYVQACVEKIRLDEVIRVQEFTCR